MQIGKLMLRWGLALVALNAALVGMSSVVARLPPSGEEIVYSIADGQQGDIYLIDMEHGFQVQLTHHPALEYGPQWMSDGEHIAFVSYRDEEFALYVMDASGKNLHRLSDTDYPHKVTAVLSPDGSKIAIGATSPLYIFDVASGEISEMTDVDSITSNPIWSPDSQHIAYMYWLDKNFDKAEVGIIAVDDQHETHLNIGSPKWLEWSPDSRQIAFISSEAAYVDSLNIVNADGSELSRLTQIQQQLFVASWSPDSRQIALSSLDEANHGAINMINTDGSNLHLLVEPALAGLGSEWSSDGSHLLFYASPNEMIGDYQTELYVIDADGINKRQLTFTPGFEANASWRPHSP